MARPRDRELSRGPSMTSDACMPSNARRLTIPRLMATGNVSYFDVAWDKISVSCDVGDIR